ncbi:Uncharacterized protein Adt_31643 [Abeliophyllum distichum]|uniref:Uncharacterized protein n=1 Tax=Abeliophyllum distichum TaxID=126358 RepID=A0ABD1REN8_9LAMI
MLNHMNIVCRAHRITALPYNMILTKIFQHFEISFHDEVFINPKLIDTINIHILKLMKIIKKWQWVAKTKGFDAESGPSTLPFERGDAMDEDDDDEDDAPPPSHPSDLPSSHMPSSFTSGFSFTKDHYNLLNGQIDSLTSTVDGLHNTVGSLQQSIDSLTLLLQQVLASQQVL